MFTLIVFVLFSDGMPHRYELATDLSYIECMVDRAALMKSFPAHRYLCEAET